jgi:polyhydroxyalkanoate synthesis regulator protein
MGVRSPIAVKQRSSFDFSGPSRASQGPHIKRYARTRLYDTEALCYVTVADLMLWVSKGISFVIIEAETGEDITRILLA